MKDVFNHRIEPIQEACADAFDLPLRAIRGKTRVAPVPDARKMVFLIARETIKGISCESIAKTVGCHHSNVVHGIKSLKSIIETEEHMKQIYDCLKERFSK